MKHWFAMAALSLGLVTAAAAAVDLNSASKEELDAVKGISPAKAQAIVDYRKENGPFKSLDELKKVKGFGDKSVAKLAGEVTVSGAPTGRDPAKKKN